MEDLEEKYSLLMGFLLPRVHKCIESIDPIKLVERGPFLEPHININIKDGCQVMGKLALRGDVFGEMINLNDLYFPNRNIIGVIDYIKINNPK